MLPADIYSSNQKNNQLSIQSRGIFSWDDTEQFRYLTPNEIMIRLGEAGLKRVDGGKNGKMAWEKPWIKPGEVDPGTFELDVKSNTFEQKREVKVNGCRELVVRKIPFNQAKLGSEVKRSRGISFPEMEKPCTSPSEAQPQQGVPQDKPFIPKKATPFSVSEYHPEIVKLKIKDDLFAATLFKHFGAEVKNGEFYYMPEHNIYGLTKEHCLTTFRNTERLAEAGGVFRLTYELMMIDQQDRTFAHLALPGNRVTVKGQDHGQATLATGFIGGKFQRVAAIPVDRPMQFITYIWGHELPGHFLHGSLNPNLRTDRSSSPLVGASTPTQMKFINVFKAAEQKFQTNPHPKDSFQWRQHEWFKKTVFDNPKNYPTESHFSEVAAGLMENEYYRRGSVREHCPELADAFQALYRERILSHKNLSRLSPSLKPLDIQLFAEPQNNVAARDNNFLKSESRGKPLMEKSFKGFSGGHFLEMSEAQVFKDLAKQNFYPIGQGEMERSDGWRARIYSEMHEVTVFHPDTPKNAKQPSQLKESHLTPKGRTYNYGVEKRGMHWHDRGQPPSSSKNMVQRHQNDASVKNMSKALFIANMGLRYYQISKADGETQQKIDMLFKEVATQGATLAIARFAGGGWADAANLATQLENVASSNLTIREKVWHSAYAVSHALIVGGSYVVAGATATVGGIPAAVGVSGMWTFSYASDYFRGRYEENKPTTTYGKFLRDVNEVGSQIARGTDKGASFAADFVVHEMDNVVQVFQQTHSKTDFPKKWRWVYYVEKVAAALSLLNGGSFGRINSFADIKQLELKKDQPSEINEGALSSPFKPNLGPLSLTAPAVSDTQFQWDISGTAAPLKLVPATASGEPAALQTSTVVTPAQVDDLTVQVAEETKSESAKVAETKKTALAVLPEYPLLRGEGKLTKPERPPFSEQMKIEQIGIEAAPNEVRLAAYLKSGAKVAVGIYGAAEGVFVGITVPLGATAAETMTALATGLAYAAPVALLIVGIQIGRALHDKKVRKHIQSDLKEGKKESSKVNSSIDHFAIFMTKYQNGEIDKDSFLQKTNDLATKIAKAGTHAGRRARYAENHKNGEQAGKGHRQDQTGLRQSAAVVREAASDWLVEVDVKNNFAASLKGLPLNALIDQFTALQKGLISFEEQCKQEALQKEILLRTKTDPAAFEQIQPLVNQPAAISLSPSIVGKPSHIGKSHFNTNDSSAKRRADRTSGWAGDLEKEYGEFRDACKNANYGEMTRIGNGILKTIKEHMDRMDGYDLTKMGKGIYTAADYYRTFYTEIKTHVETSLKKGSAAQTRTLNEETKSLFPENELKALFVEGSINRFNTNLSACLNKDLPTTDRDNALKEAIKEGDALEKAQVPLEQLDVLKNILSKYKTMEQYELSLLKEQEYDAANLVLANPETPYPEQEIALEQKYQAALILEKNNNSPELVQALKAAIEFRTSVKENYGTIEQYDASEKAIKDFNDAVPVLNDPDSTVEKQNAAFEKRYLAALVLSKNKKNSKEDQENFENAIAIRNEYETWNNYQTIQARRNIINSLWKELSDTNEKFKGVTKKKALKLLSLEAAEKAKKLLEADVIRDLKMSPEEAKKVIASVKHQSLFKTFDHYGEKVQVYATAGVRLVTDALVDLQRTSKSRSVQVAAGSVTTIHSVFPAVLPSIATAVTSYVNREDRIVVEELYGRIKGAFFNHAFRQLIHPRAAWEAATTWNRKACLAQNVNTAIQLVARGLAFGVNLTVDRIISEEAADQVNSIIGSAAKSTGLALTTAYNSNLVYQTYRYYNAGTLSSKVHKIGQGWAAIALSGFDIYEYLATESNGAFAKKIQSYLPNFKGNLPENWWYYASKDLGMAGAFNWLWYKEVPHVGESALYHLGKCVYKFATRKHSDEALTAILLNCRYRATQPPSPERNAGLERSLENLKGYLGDGFAIGAADSEVMISAKVFYFEYCLEELYREKKWEELLKLTAIKNWNFTALNGNVTLALNVWFKRATVHIERLYQKQFAYGEVIQFLEEADRFSDYLKTSGLRKKNLQEVQKMIAGQKLEMLTHCCNFFSFTENKFNPFVALEIFGHIPKDQRLQGEHWYMMGRIVQNLADELPATEALSLYALARGCFFFLNNLLESKPARTSNENELGGRCKNVLHFFDRSMGNQVDRIFHVKGDENFSELVHGMVSENRKKTKLTVKSRPQGLDNLANTCFMNAALQIILHNPSILESLKVLLPVTQDPKNKRFLSVLQEMYSLDEIESIDLLKFHAVCTEMGFVNKLGAEEDAQELLIRITSRFPNILNLPLELISGIRTLEGMFVSLERLMDPPEYIHVHLGRFSETNEQAVFVKNEESIILPPNGALDLGHLFKSSRKQVYDIIGRVNHKGSLEKGHYTTDILKGSQWYHINDDQVFAKQAFNWNDTKDPSAYVLILKKRNR